MARAAHGAAGATAAAAAGGSALFLIAFHFQNDCDTQTKQTERDDDGREILSEPIQYDHRESLLSL